VSGSAVYAALIRLYPAEFRRDYGADLVQCFEDLANDRGRVSAWARTSLDLAITVPRYRLETIVNPRRSSAVLNLAIGGLTLAGLALLSGASVAGLGFLAVAAIVGLAQRTSLARALRTPDTHRRRRRLRRAGGFAVFALVTFGVFTVDIGGDHDWGARAFAYAYAFYAASLAAIISLVVGLLTPKSPGRAAHGATSLT
jgi:hypothetical protein